MQERPMPIDEEPVVGAVYEDAEGRTFEVTGFDEDEATVKLRYDDGAVEEIDLDAWYELEIEQISSPEDADDDEDDLEPASADEEDLLDVDEDEDEDLDDEGDDYEK
jgi:hypothetical protein